MKEPIEVKNCFELQLHIHVLGYFPDGESILIVLWDNVEKKPLQSILTDCFEKGGINQMHSVLRKYGIDKSKLNYVIWTHPDKDHSIGFSSIAKDFSSKSTVFLIADGMFAFKDIFDSEKIKSWMAVFNKAIRSRKSVESINTSNNRKQELAYGETFTDGINENVDFDIEPLTPFANQVSRKLFYNKTRKGNDISISFIVRLGPVGFYFGGDSENAAINQIMVEKFCDVRFIKIPHHGSNSSDVLPSIILKAHNGRELNPIVSVCTSYHHGEHPDPRTTVLDQYKPFCSHILKTEDDYHKNEYGIWQCSFGRKSNLPIAIIPMGDASKYWG